MNDQNLFPFFIISIALIALLALIMVCFEDVDELQAQQDQYCEMVALWNADAKRGIPPEQRVGWPPYQGEEYCPK